MPSWGLAALVWFGRIAAVLGIGLQWTGRILDVVIKAVTQSKIFFTISFMITVVGFFVFAQSMVEVILGLLGVNDLFMEVVQYGFVNDVVDLTPILSLGKWFLGYWITSKLLLSSAIGARLFFAFFGQFQKAIKL